MATAKPLAARPGRFFDIKNVKVDLTKLFSKLSEAAVHAAFAKGGQSDEVAQFVGSLVESAEAFSVKSPVEVRAWRLVFSALAQALYEIVGAWEHAHIDAMALRKLLSVIEKDIGKLDVALTPDFFRNPGGLPILKIVSEYFENWLAGFGLGQPESKIMASRVPSYFTFAIHNEWRKQRDFYAPVLGALESPFVAAAELEEDWERYRVGLLKQLDQPVFGETFSLRHIYVPLRAAFPEEKQAKRTPEIKSVGETDLKKRRVVDLHEEVAQWIDKATHESAVCIIEGGPGCGKSSFVKKLAADLSEKATHHVLFFPLQRFLLNDRLTTAISTYLFNTEAFTQNPLEQKEFATKRRRLILIFDGLDELTKPGELAETEARRFLAELRTTLAQWNSQQCRVLAVVTGRTAIVQASRDAIRVAPAQELSVLRLFLSDEEKRTLVGPRKLKNIDQRYIWWAQYQKCKSNEPSKIPGSLSCCRFR